MHEQHGVVGITRERGDDRLLRAVGPRDQPVDSIGDRRGLHENPPVAARRAA
jgi:hypothetical protein